MDEPHQLSVESGPLRLLAIELLFAVPISFIWVAVLGLSELWLIAGLLGVRLVIDVGYGWIWLAPVRAWEAARADEAALRAADRALQSGLRRVIAVITATWLAIIGLALVLASAGIGAAHELGPAEISTGLVIMFAAALGLPCNAFSIMRDAVEPVQRAITIAAREQKIELRRPQKRLANMMLTTILLQSITGLLAFGAIAGLFRAQGIQATALAEQARRVEHAATDIDAGRSPELEIVDELPPALVEATPDARGVITAYRARGELVHAAAPLADGRWVVTTVVVDQGAWTFTGILLAIVAALAVPIGYGALAEARAVTSPLIEIDDATRRFVESGDLRGLGRVVPLRSDEIGGLVGNFNRMLDLLEVLAAAASAVADGDLRVELDHPGELHDAFRGMLGRLHAMVERIRETSVELASTAAEIHAATQEQEAVAEQQATSASDVSDNVASLAAAATAITEVAQTVLDNAEQARATTDAMVAKIGELSAQAAGIGELLEIIRDVADRSDLIALNGSLEATRAGEAGRGFALVAAEMRRLAERVTGTVADVRERVAQIKASGSSTVMATEDSRKLAESTAAAARQISTVTVRQGEDTNAVSITIQEVAEAIVASASAISQTRSAAEGLRARAEVLEALTGAFQLRRPREQEGRS